jgi:hypothetical protein
VALAQGTDVEEGEHVLVFIHFETRDFAAQDSVEYGLRHTHLMDEWG